MMYLLELPHQNCEGNLAGTRNVSSKTVAACRTAVSRRKPTGRRKSTGAPASGAYAGRRKNLDRGHRRRHRRRSYPSEVGALAGSDQLVDGADGLKGDWASDLSQLCE